MCTVQCNPDGSATDILSTLAKATIIQVWSRFIQSLYSMCIWNDRYIAIQSHNNFHCNSYCRDCVYLELKMNPLAEICRGGTSLEPLRRPFFAEQHFISILFISFAESSASLRHKISSTLAKFNDTSGHANRFVHFAYLFSPNTVSAQSSKFYEQRTKKALLGVRGTYIHGQ
jgi:hypothetical protein